MRTPEILALASRHAPSLVAALLHSLWQAALPAILCKALLRAVPFRRPDWRYGIALGSLALVVLLFLATWRLETRSRDQSANAPTVVAASDTAVHGETDVAPHLPPPPASPTTELAAHPASPSADVNWQVLLVCVWLAGVMSMLFRAVWVLRGESRFARLGQPVEDSAIHALLDELRGRLGTARRVAIASVDAVCSPAVVGVVSPVILIPASLLTGTSTAQLRAILAHELAHIRRWDVLVNLLQLLVESLFFHNPFVWLLSAQIRQEREACCDAVAAECCGGGPVYARVLVDIGQTVLASSTAVSLAQPNGLGDRVRRILGVQPVGDTWRLPARSLFVGLLAGLAAMFAVAQGTFKATDAILAATRRIELIEQTVARQKKAPSEAVGTTRYTGTVATADGKAFPRRIGVILLSTEPDCGYRQIGVAIDPKTGRFDIPTTARTAVLYVYAEGYSPLFGELMVPRDQPVTDTGVWKLEPETPLVVRVLGPDGKPVPNAKVCPSWQPTALASFLGPTGTTDEEGECTIPLVTKYPMGLTIEATDLEPDSFAGLSPQAGEPLVLHLKPSLPLVIHVTNKSTGAPISGVRIRRLAWQSPGSGGASYPDRATVLGTTSTDGTCTIQGLHRKGVYWLLVEAKRYGPELLERITPGKRQDVRLGPPRVVNGTISGDLAKLTANRRQPEISIRHTYTYPGGGEATYEYVRVPVHIQDGLGTFRVDNLYRGTFQTWIGKQLVTFSTEDGNTNVYVDIPLGNPPPEPTREVRLSLKPQSGFPFPRGTMRVNYRPPNERYRVYRDLPVQDGVDTFRAPVGHYISYEPAGVLGGWFPSQRFDGVTAGDTPLTIRVPFVPAGAISVSVVNADGSPAEGFMVSVQELAKSPLRQDRFSLSGLGKDTASSDDGIHAFTVTPLPLDGTYGLVVYRGYTYVMTNPIRLTEEHPLHKQRLVLAGDATITGQVVDLAGNPIPKIPVCMRVELSRGSFGTSDIETDEDGRFTFAGVVRQPDAKYAVRLRPKHGFVPLETAVPDLDRPVRLVAKPVAATPNSGREK